MVSARPVTKAEPEERTLRLAVLIDADNAQAAVIEDLLAEIARYGEATVKRIYGDFTVSTSSAWKKVLQKYAIKPIQQFAYTTGKNATDSALIIDAMDKSELSAPEKKELRKEVRSIKKELRDISGGVYLSVGAVIIIILLLILLL